MKKQRITRQSDRVNHRVCVIISMNIIHRIRYEMISSRKLYRKREKKKKITSMVVNDVSSNSCDIPLRLEFILKIYQEKHRPKIVDRMLSLSHAVTKRNEKNKRNSFGSNRKLRIKFNLYAKQKPNNNNKILKQRFFARFSHNVFRFRFSFCPFTLNYFSIL